MMFKSEYNSELLPDGDDLLLSLSSRDEPSPSSSFGDLDPQQAEGGSSNPDSFPTVLYGIVSDESTDDCIRWLPCGTRFQITDKNKFSKKVIPIYFGSRGATKFTSFTRRLKRWKFNREAKGPQMGAYYNENFIRGKPELLSKIIYPGVRAGPTAPAPSKSSPKVKSANKARRRASTGSLLQPFVDPFDVVVGSILEPTDSRNKEFDEGEMFDISPTPVRSTLNLSSESPILTKDFTNWLSDTNFFSTPNDNNGLGEFTTRDLASPEGPASVVSLSSQPPPPPLSNKGASLNAGVETHKPFRLASRRHSCIASIHLSSSQSYDVPLNDTKAKRNADFDTIAPTPFPYAPTSSHHIPDRTFDANDDDTLRMMKQNRQNFTDTMPKVQQHQRQQQWQQQQQQHHHHHHHQHQGQQQWQQQWQQHQPRHQPWQQQQQQKQQQQLLRFVSESKSPAPMPTQQQPQPILTQSMTASMPKKQNLPPQQQQHQQHQTQNRSSFQDELDDLFRFSREFTLEDFLSDA